ncbi:hypothetical protein STEG23_030117 [Scotinomys teguina]
MARKAGQGEEEEVAQSDEEEREDVVTGPEHLSGKAAWQLRLMDRWNKSGTGESDRNANSRLADFLTKADKECGFVTVHISSVQAKDHTGNIFVVDDN